MAALPPSPASSLQIPSGSTTSAGSSGGATASSKRKRRLHDLSTDEINEIVALRGKLSQAVVGKKYGIEQTEVSAIQRMQRVKTARLVDENEKKVCTCTQSFLMFPRSTLLYLLFSLCRIAV
jgi:hypothetical protein